MAERTLLLFLVGQPSLDRYAEMLQQAQHAEVAEEFGKGERSLRLSLPENAIAAKIRQRVPVSAVGSEDGVPVEVLLHIVDGFLDELEVFRVDSQPLKHYPQPESLHIL